MPDPPVVIIQDMGVNNRSDGLKKKRAKTTKTDDKKLKVPPVLIFRPNSNELLTNMLHPLPTSDFLRRHFRKDAVYIQRSNHNRSQDEMEQMLHDICHNYLFDLDVRKIFRETSSENVFLWLRPPSTSTAESNDGDGEVSKAALPTSTLLHSVEISDPDTAYALHQTGLHSAYCRAPPILEQHLVSSLLRATGLGGGHYHSPHAPSRTLGGGTTMGRGEVELFVSSGGGNVTGWHTDFQENFTIQLSGVKRWTLRRGRVRHPLRGTTPHYARDASVVENQLKLARLCCSGKKSDASIDEASFNGQYGYEYDDNNAFGPEQTITLHTGDVLYFPAGMWHKVETLEPGISLNVSLMGTTYANLVCEALQHVMYGSDEGWREIVTSRPEDTNVDGVQRLEGLLSGLGSLVHTFIEQGGAQSLLPPALLHPPLGTNVGSSLGNGSEEDDIDEESDNGDDGNEGNEESDCDIVIDMDQFEGPPGWTYSQPPNAKKLVKNPLASLIPIPEISKHKKDAGRYVLNVNFAGNEMMESHIRVVLETTDRKLIDRMKTFVLVEEQGIPYHGILGDPPPKCLFYFGYFSWKT